MRGDDDDDAPATARGAEASPRARARRRAARGSNRHRRKPKGRLRLAAPRVVKASRNATSPTSPIRERERVFPPPFLRAATEEATEEARRAGDPPRFETPRSASLQKRVPPAFLRHGSPSAPRAEVRRARFAGTPRRASPGDGGPLRTSSPPLRVAPETASSPPRVARAPPRPFWFSLLRAWFPCARPAARARARRARRRARLPPARGPA